MIVTDSCDIPPDYPDPHRFHHYVYSHVTGVTVVYDLPATVYLPLWRLPHIYVYRVSLRYDRRKKIYELTPGAYLPVGR